MAFLNSHKAPAAPVSTASKLDTLATALDDEAATQLDSADQYRAWAQTATVKAAAAVSQSLAVREASRILSEAGVTL
jgi:hypothetical protein